MSMDIKIALIGFLSGAFGTLVGAVVALQTNHDNVAVKYIEMAVGILSAKSEGDDQELRTWAVKVIDHYAARELKIGGVLKTQLIHGKVHWVEEDDKASGSGCVGTEKPSK